MVQGSDFDKTLDAMLEKMSKSGLSEDQMMKQLMGNMAFNEKQSGEINFDPSKANLDPALF
jgi:hypothetical protein